MPGLKRRFTSILIVAILASTFAYMPIGTKPAFAISSNLVISQVYGGGGNSGAPFTHDYIEIFNRGTTSISLDGLSLQYASATASGNFGSSNAEITVLPNVTLSAGQYYLVQQASQAAVGAALPAPDLVDSTPAAMSGTGGKVVLASGTNSLGCNGGSNPCNAAAQARIIDLVGYGGANFFEGSGATPAPNNQTAAIRAGAGCTETDNNSADFATGAPAPRNTSSPLHPCAGPVGVMVSIEPTDASAAETGPDTGSFTISRSGSTTTTLSVSFSVDGNAVGGTDYSPGLSGSATINAGQSSVLITVTPVDDTAVEGNETVVLTLLDTAEYDPGSPSTATLTITDNDTVLPPLCSQTFTPIFQIQGSGASAAITGSITTQGVVVGDFEGSGGLSGFYLQDPTGDGDAATSDGIFVHTGNANAASPGRLVRVTGFAREQFGQTTINGSNADNGAVPVADVINCGPASLPTAATVTMPFSSANDLERFEAMLVNFSQTLTIAEYFRYARFGEIVLAWADDIPELGGTKRLYAPTSIVEPGAAANALAAKYALRRIVLDDGLSTQNPSVLRHPNGNPFSLSNRFRGGDTVQNVVGILGFGFGSYRVQPTQPAQFSAANPRPAAPEPAGGSLRVGALNTLNFFLTLDYASGNPLDNKCGPSQNLECRGADADQPNEFKRQRDKLLQTIVGLNADALGLNELENTPNAEPLANIVAGLNSILGPGTYDYIKTGTIGTDAIKVGIIYKPAALTPVGNYAILRSSVDPRFIDTLNRPSLAQTFKQPNGARFTMVVNHLKSKGSPCAGDPDTGDGQGNCKDTRKAAAQAIVDWLATDPTGSGDPDFLVLGDLNANAQEDSVDAIRAGADDSAGTGDDWTNLLAAHQGAFAYSYAFDGQIGYLDHALGNPSLSAQVTGATEWHIDADEPDIFDYDTSFKPPAQDALYEANAFRTSDHDPVLVGLDLHAPAPPPGSQPTSGPQQPNCETFAQTGKTVCGRFLRYWLEHGSLRLQGYPISGELIEVSEIDGKTYTIQYFERAIFELHPENQPPYDVLLSHLGRFRYSQKYPGGAPQGATLPAELRPEASITFPQTGKQVSGAFIDYWLDHGGVPQHGYPISDAFVERSELDGKEYIVQYFERSVLEYHPENELPYRILPALLGTLEFNRKQSAPTATISSR